MQEEQGGTHCCLENPLLAKKQDGRNEGFRVSEKDAGLSQTLLTRKAEGGFVGLWVCVFLKKTLSLIRN